MKNVRLDKFLSDNTPLTRSQIRNLIKRGVVCVGEYVVRSFDFKINPDNDKVYLNNQPIDNTKNIYLLMNKPSGILTASKDKSRQTVLDLVPQEYKHLDLFAVGRLDKDTTGLLLITNDGDFAHRVISPKSNITKVYTAEVDGSADKDAVHILAEGVTLADGTKCRPAKLEFLDKNKVRVTVTEGKYHLVKRALGVVGLGVLRLHRDSIGKLSLPQDMMLGDVIVLNDAMIRDVFE